MSARWRGMKLFSKKTRPSTRQRRHQPLMLEECEDRRLLAVFTVTSSLDTGAIGELRWAVNAANAVPGHDLINFDVGNVALTQGELPITDTVTIDGTSALPVLVDISAAANARIFNIDDANPDTLVPVEMVQLQLRQGNLSAFANAQGGSILNHEHLDFNLSLINDSRARMGGGIANHGYLRMDGSTISEATALGYGGGGLYNGPRSEAIIASSTISGNRAHIGAGGGVLNVAADMRVVDDSLISNNYAATQGGGISASEASAVTIRAASLTQNEAALGGAVAVEGLGSNLTTGAQTLLEANTASWGGGIAAFDQAHVEVTGSVLSGNRANIEGGGLWAETATAQLHSAQLISNQAGNAFGDLGRGAGGVCQSRCRHRRVRFHLQLQRGHGHSDRSHGRWRRLRRQ